MKGSIIPIDHDKAVMDGNKERTVTPMGEPYETIVNVPPVVDIGAALKTYYEKRELTVADIMELFGVGRSKAARLKQRALEEQRRDGRPLWNGRAVNTECAFRSWGIEVRELENRLGALRRLRLNV